MNTFERLIAVISPSAAVRRAAKRELLRHFESYEGAGKGRRTSGWRHSRNSADADILPSISTLRDNSRNMQRNNPYASKALSGLVNNSVAVGIRPNFKSEKNPAGAKKLKNYWKKWYETTECDFERLLSGYGQQSLAARGMFESGECLIVRRKLKSSDNGVLNIRMQLLEPDYIDHTRNQPNSGTGNYMIHGIEYNQNGLPVAYWLFQQHPGDLFGYFPTSTRVLAEDVIQLYRQLRPGQKRGVPAGTSSFLRLNDFDDYEDAELMRQKVAACFSTFISGSSDLPGTDDEDDSETKKREKIAPGMITRLNPGEQVSFASPPGPVGYGEFGRKSQQGSAAGYGVTYEIMTGDLSNVNFSSMRIGTVEFNKEMNEIQQNTIISKYCERVFKWFMDGVMLQETILFDDLEVDWIPPRKEMMDVDKETKAAINQVLGGFQSWSELVTEYGNNPDDLKAAIAKDQSDFKAMNIKLTSDATNVIVPAAGDTQTSEQNTEEGVGSGGKTGK